MRELHSGIKIYNPANMRKSKFSSSKGGFSLVEVVVAVGIFALAIVGVIGLLSPTNKAISDVTDSDSASRVISAIQTGMQQIVKSSSSGFTSIAGDLSADSANPTYLYYASKSGDKVGKAADVPASERFFEFALIRNDTLSPVGNDNTAGFLAFTISLRWPAYLPNGAQFTVNAQKSVMIVPAAITR